MPQVLDHIHHKLERAEEHIRQLHNEVEAFLDEAPHRRINNGDAEALKAFERFHHNRPIPPRLSIVAGDSVHQMRSSLDHLLVGLIRRECGVPTRKSQFPIWDREPTTKQDKSAYQGQVKGIGREDVLDAIKDLQPYKRPRPINSWLRILGALSNTDKHNALILTVVWAEQRISVEMCLPDNVSDVTIIASRPDDGAEVPKTWVDPSGDRVEVMNMERSIAALVAFDQWGDGNMGPIQLVDGLRGLHEGVTKIVSDFTPFF